VNNEEKILEILTKMQTQMDGMQSRMDGMQSRMDSMQTQMDTRFAQIDDRFAQMDTRLSQMDAHFTKLDADVAGIRVLVDVDIETKLNLLAEGHQTLLETLAPKTKTEELEENYALLRSVVAALSRDVAELKKAQ